jgi:hypothetical protein
VGHWHESLDDPTLADAILDRLVHNAYKLNLKGDSIRKTRPGASSLRTRSKERELVPEPTIREFISELAVLFTSSGRREVCSTPRSPAVAHRGSAEARQPSQGL